jgi:hypothetical protein
MVDRVVGSLVLALAVLPATALANQPQPEGGNPPPPPAAAPGSSDHNEVVGAIGIQIAASTPLTGGPSANAIGVRYWMNEKLGIDGGFALTLDHNSPPAGDGTTQVGFGLVGGVPMALGIYKHITTFFEPTLDFFLAKPNVGDTQFAVELLGSLGFELQLGYVEASRVSLQMRIGGGLRVTSAGNTDVNFSTAPGTVGLGGAATRGGVSVAGASATDLFQSTFALTFYL